jgi:hypothetical protein
MLIVDSKVVNLLIPLMLDSDLQIRTIVLQTFTRISVAFTYTNLEEQNPSKTASEAMLAFLQKNNFTHLVPSAKDKQSTNQVALPVQNMPRRPNDTIRRLHVKLAEDAFS